MIAHKEIVERVMDLDIVDIIGQYARVVPFGAHHATSCPLCQDGEDGKGKVDRFRIYRDSNKAYCHSCTANRGKFLVSAIDYVMQRFGLEYYPAMYKIALDNGIVTSDEFAKLMKGKLTQKQLNETKEVMATRESEKAKIEIKKADISTRNLVYRTFLAAIKAVCGLNPEHKEALITKRGYTEAEIESKLFVTFPDETHKQAVLDKMAELLTGIPETEGMDDVMDICKYVPGFKFVVMSYMPDPNVFKTKVDNKWVTAKGKDRGFWTFYTYEDAYCQIIPDGNPTIENDGIGQIQSLQIRVSDAQAEKFGGGKYRGFSSPTDIGDITVKDPATKKVKKKSIWGASAGTPIGVERPHHLASKAKAITEGMPKAHAWANASGMMVTSTQGVTNWKPLFNTLEDIEANKSIQRELMGLPVNKDFYIGFDMDMLYKQQVFKQARLLAAELRKRGYTTYYATWKIRMTEEDIEPKGIDDYIVEYGYEGIKYVPCEVIDVKHDLITAIIRKDHKIGEKDDIGWKIFIKYIRYYGKPISELSELKERTVD